MIAIVRPSSAVNTVTAAHDQFVSMLPKIRLHASVAFRHRGHDDREEFTQEVIANAYSAFVRLIERGKADLAFATPLAHYAIRQVRYGRRMGSRLNQHDAMSPANRRKGVERLDHYDSAAAAWKEVLVEDRRATPADTAAARIDLAQWFSLLPVRKRRIAKALAAGETTAAAARQFGVSPARISQLRQELRGSWQALQGELAAT